MEENLKIKNSLIKEQLFSETHFKQVEAYGIDLNKIAEELQLFKTGIPKVVVEKPATKNDGILVFSPVEMESFAAKFDTEKSKFSLEKFVPASGAASRMFKFLSAFLLEFNPEKETINSYINRKKETSLQAFIIGMDKFPFFTAVYTKLKEKHPDFDSWKRDDKNYFFIKILLDSQGFDFANKPKGILPFHVYPDSIATPIEEHLKEALLYAKSNGMAKIHFTISGEHQNDFEKIVSQFNSKEVEVTYSEQLKTTDTIAVDFNNIALKESGQLIFRPGGHGALIYNLNQINSDLVFIKNIDNVSHNNLNEIALYKKGLGGYLIEIQTTVFEKLRILERDKVSKELIVDIQNFIENKLKIELSKDFKNFKKDSKIKYLKTILDRPIRLCGMVKNENEPGGGPFWIRDKEGSISLQIVESSQIDIQNENQVHLFKSATHFNPVDLVCGIKKYNGEKFNLLDFVDNQSGFIVEKSKSGIDYKAYELPGLWNGAMANWITLFVEVPLETFNPVKTVNDLLKYNHQPQ